MRLINVFLFTVFTFAYCQLDAQSMNNQRLGKILEEAADTLIGGNGQWQFLYQQLPLYCITDESHNRMRIISPIVEVNALDKTILEKALEANFHTALDVKYAISDSVMWAVFIHPLKELSDDQLRDAVKQVAAAARNFGGSYSSTPLFFPSRLEEE